jgi:hypothetical protein
MLVVVDPAWVEAIGVWAIGIATVVIACYQYKLSKSQAEIIKSKRSRSSD